jgi:hypothetical protein
MNRSDYSIATAAGRAGALCSALFLAGSMCVAVSCASADTNVINSANATNHAGNAPAVSPAPAPAAPQSDAAMAARSEQIRAACIEGRRRICGKVLQIVPEGLVVESGYVGLLRPELSRSWVAPGTVSVTRPPNLVEEKIPGSVCVGLVMVTDIPKKPAVKPYDYVILEAYPAGQYLYTPVPNVKKNIRRFSVGLLTAVKLNLDAAR